MNDNEFGEAGQIVLAAAAKVPTRPHDLRLVRRKGIARQRRRLFAMSFGAAVVTAASVAVPFAIPRSGALTHELTQEMQPSVSTSPPTTVMAQRLLIFAGSPTTATPEPQPDGGTSIRGETGEVLGDGSFMRHTWLSGFPNLQQMVPTPDGGWALLTSVDLRPDLKRDDGECVSDIATPLILVDANGKRIYERDVHQQCHPIRLIGVHNGLVYMVRDNDFVLHDPRTGRESKYKSFGGVGSPRAGIDGDILYTFGSPEGGSCPKFTLRTINLKSGSDTTREITPPTCGHFPMMVRISPDGRLIAFDYHSRRATTVVIARIDTGEILATRDVETPISTGGMAWVDDRTIRAAYAKMAPPGAHYLHDILQIVVITA